MAPTLVDCTATGVAKPRLPHMPENIWLDIFGYLSLEEKVRLSRTCKTWHRIVDDPSLYTHIHLDHMEFDTLVKSMHHLVRRAPRIRSLRISNCFSAFISRTTVPVQNTPALHDPFAAAVAAAATATTVIDSANVSDGAVSDAAPSAMTPSPSSPVGFASEATAATMTSTQSPPPPQFGLHSLHTHITSFTLPRRREEYRKLGFTLHQEFSRALVVLMEQSQESLSSLEIQDNFLDLEMTELIFCIVRYGRHLERLLYDGNRDGGFVAPEVVSAITAACPNIRSFRGKHAISDTVLRRMLSGWEQLRSITLAPFHSPALGPKEISLEGLWSLLECSQVERLELLDLDCLSNENLAKLVERVKQLEALSIDRWRSSTLPLSTSSAHAHPLAHHGIRCNNNNNNNDTVEASMSRPGSPATTTRPLPGASVRHLTLTKFTSMPLTLPGFGLLLKLFPNLETLVFTTNYFAYDHQFRGLTKEIYETEIEMVERTVQTEMAARWGNAAMSPVLSCVSSWWWPNGSKSGLPSVAPAVSSPWLDMRLRWRADWNAPWTEEQRLRAGIMRA